MQNQGDDAIIHVSEPIEMTPKMRTMNDEAIETQFRR